MSGLTLSGCWTESPQISDDYTVLGALHYLYDSILVRGVERYRRADIVGPEKSKENGER